MRTITVRMEDGALADVDRVRGPIPREVYVRGLLRDAVAAHDAPDVPTEVVGGDHGLEEVPREEPALTAPAPARTARRKAPASAPKLRPGQRKPGGIAVHTEAAARGPVQKRSGKR